MISFFNSKLTSVADIFNKWPIASACVLAFAFIIMRLCIPMEPLFLFLFIVSCLLILLNTAKKISNFLMAFIFCAMVVGVFTASYSVEKTELITERYRNEYVHIRGEIISIPTESNCIFIKTEEIHSKYGEDRQKFNVYAAVDTNADLKYGDKIVLNCHLYEPESINSTLSYYYFSKGAPLIAENITFLDVNDGSSQFRFITNVRNYIIDLGDKYLSGDAKALFKALVAGDKSTFSKDLSLNLSKSGLSHIACVSGLHVSILGMAIYNLISRKRRGLSSVISTCAVFIFAFITGATPSTLRAAIMFTVFIVSRLVIRENHSFTALSLSAVILGVINPFVIFDWGFILSYLSVLGIEIFSVFFKKLFSFLPEFVSDSLSVTLGAQIMTLPAITNMFGYLPLYSIFANIIISLIFVYVLYICFLFIPLVSVPYVGKLAVVLCTGAMDIVAAIANFFADLPYSIINIDTFDIYEIITFYIIVLMFTFRKKLSVYFISTGFLICSILLSLSVFVSSPKVRQYTLADGSVFYMNEDCNVLEVKSNIMDSADAFISWGRRENIDYIVASGDVSNQESGLIEFKNHSDVLAIYIPDGLCDYTFESISHKIGVECRFYREETDELIRNIQQEM